MVFVWVYLFGFVCLFCVFVDFCVVCFDWFCCLVVWMLWLVIFVGVRVLDYVFWVGFGVGVVVICVLG